MGREARGLKPIGDKDADAHRFDQLCTEYGGGNKVSPFEQRLILSLGATGAQRDLYFYLLDARERNINVDRIPQKPKECLTELRRRPQVNLLFCLSS